MSEINSQYVPVCAICLESVQSRGGQPLYSPGCCGKWFHQSCMDEMIASNPFARCPNCQKNLPVSQTAATLPLHHGANIDSQTSLSVPPPPPSQTVAAAPTLIPAPAPVLAQAVDAPRKTIFGRMFNFRNNDTRPPIPPQSTMASRRTNAMNNLTVSAPISSNSNMTEEPIVAKIAEMSISEKTLEVLPHVTINTSPEFPEVHLGAHDQFHARVSLQYHGSEEVAATKTPLDIVCILDNSGSMTGSKLESLKKAMEFVVDCLGQGDRLSVIHFNSTPGGLHGLLKMSADNKDRSKRLLRELRATGGTNILSGMQFGWDIMQRRTTHNQATCVFLLTDGQDRSNMQQKTDLARSIKASGASLFVFGFGTDHDSEHMAAISDAAEGTFTYVESDDMVIDAFGGAIGTQQGRSLSNITLSLQAYERDVTIAQILAGRYTTSAQADGRAGTVSFLNMYMGETRDILVRLSLPLIASEETEYGLLTASASYQINGSESSSTGSNSNSSGTNNTAVVHEVAPTLCSVHRLPAERLNPSLQRDLQVDVSLNRAVCTDAVTEALRSADAGNFGIAKEVLAAAKTKLQASVSFLAGNNTVVALMQELDDALLRVRSRGDYEYGGRAMMTETYTTNMYQRACYTKRDRTPKYQTSDSINGQTSASRSKGIF